MMNLEQISIFAPDLDQDCEIDEAKILGQIFWLWYQDPHRSKHSVEGVMLFTLPAIKSRQIVVFYHDGNPIGYFSYAQFGKVEEKLYCDGQHDFLIDPQRWISGDRTWILNWFAPFGHNWQLVKITKRLFPHRICRALSATGRPNELVLTTYRGINVSLQEQKYWSIANRPPLSTNSPH